MEIGIVRQVDIEERMKSAYLDYAMSVITARALPDVRDGLKPVQRRILYAMNDMGLQHDKPYKKSARIVGEVLGKYHPHGDAAVYDAMVRMAQGFTMRYLVIDGQGNFGSVDGDNPAAMRYTEARLAPISAELLADIDSETVDYMDNFDGTLREPTVLPARIPNLLLNGASGIAVGMATNVPPHSLNEICDAAIFLIDRYSRLDSVSIDELMQLVKGPDFPTGGTILGLEGIRSAYATGKGSITMRAKAHFEDAGGGKSLIVITELPYQVGKAALIERIAELVRDKKIDTLSDLRDESDRQGMRILLELKRGVEPRPALMQLYKYTPMQSNFNVNLLALVEGEPRVLSLKRVLQLFTEHRLDVITRRSRYELERAKQRVHILEGLRTALDHLDEVIDTIRRSRNADTAQLNLQRKFNLTEVQARAILDLQLRRLAALERHKIDEEYSETLKRIKYLEGLLRSRHKILEVIKSELQEMKARYGDERRTRISEKEADEITVEDLISEEDVFVAVTQAGYVKRISRQGNPLSRMPKDAIQYLTETNTLHRVLFCTNKGRCHTALVHQIPNSQGPDVLLSNLLSLESDERVRAIVDLPDVKEDAYLTLGTVQGRVKRIPVEEFSAVRAGGLSAINLDDGDEVGWAQLTDGNRELILVTEGGQALRFAESEIRAMGRSAAGVCGIKLTANDRVVGMDLVEDNGFLLVVTEKGYAKRTSLSDYRPQGRYTQGVATIAAGVDQSGRVAAACVVAQNDSIAVLRSSSAAVSATASDIPVRGRSTRGTRVLELKGKDAVCGLARLAARARTRPSTAPGTVSTGKAPSSRKRAAGGSPKRVERSPRPPKRRGTGGRKAPASRMSRSEKKTKKS